MRFRLIGKQLLTASGGDEGETQTNVYGAEFTPQKRESRRLKTPRAVRYPLSASEVTPICSTCGEIESHGQPEGLSARCAKANEAQ
jgi:ribosomal protein L32